jgi:type IV pilus assembly protein PilE
MTTRPHRRPAGQHGFTLIELVVAMLVAALLATIALSSYSGQVRKSRRVEAKTALLDLAGREERNFSATNTYTVNAASLGYTGAFPVTVGSGYYTVAVTIPDPTQPAPGPQQPPTYLLTATPLGDQLQDTKCTVFTVNNQGLQTASDPSCW